MGTALGRPAPPLAETLRTEPYRFEFFQAVRLLELLARDTVPVGTGVEPTREAVRFRSLVGFAFPASDIAELDAPLDPTAQWEMTVAFLGLAGVQGPLPRVWVEQLLERVAKHDTAMRDFLDLFNHRLVSLFHRVKRVHRIGFETVRPEDSPMAQHLFALAGFGTPGLRSRLGISDRAILAYLPLLLDRPRSMEGLVRLVSGAFSVPCVGRQFAGRYRRLAEDQQTRLGVRGANRTLGDDVVLGTKVWDQGAGVDLCIGPLSRERFDDLLPGAKGHRALAQLVRAYAGPALDVELELTLADRDVPASRLDSVGGVRLGRAAWLGTGASPAPPADPDSVRVPLRGE